ncbi:bifunctional UDP-N-acetylglucosamine diphosphorylase/glucosamine-1-phosphate N-acetyltransferase GlmU [Aerococcaceae bacterium zg-BR22]|uniref:bifunctional UDP-N-acetylglucosamine diphosphorylase/glucosamine-1-phosphate N-acetyltransferase GlmU n=1 Tax=Aerococcaceae bacterium zg-1292 TaxID=2774330 RepID=UPI004063DFD8|nr:bifunctional UDP-N-acetylglucosamine diphosphorylase/glucosamine-1-phosphate N-acetyltransferase GlmU [Aerococcaceae bacterium zg-BR22]
MDNRIAVILAAGKGTRMKSSLYKVLHPVCGLSMVEHVVRAVKESNVNQIVTIVGHGAEQVKSVLGDQSEYALQEEQLGTGHAVLQAEAIIGREKGQTLVICGDTPLLSGATLNQLFAYHESTHSHATVLTAVADDSTGYGRIVRSPQGQVERIVEQKDATDEEKQIKEINTGTYVFDNEKLFNALTRVTNDNAQGEYYLPDVIELIKADGGMVSAYIMDDMNEALGVNDRVALAQASQLMTQRINEKHMRQGVTIINPLNTVIEADVVIGEDTVIEPGVYLKGNTVIGRNCLIGTNSEIVDSNIEQDVQITQSVIEQSTVQPGVTIGPFAHLRPNSHLGKNVHIGNFVEVKNSTIDEDTKAGHLTYIGDADLGKNINIGCGTIFVNYDGKHKHRSSVGDNSFIGCNANIVSPVQVGARAFIAAGTTLTKDVPAEALAISRVEQRNIADYWDKLQKK